MQRKKSGFFSHSANILIQPKYHKITCSVPSSAKWKAEELPAIFQMYKCKALTLKLFFLYIARGFSGSKICVQQTEKKANLSNNLIFFSEKNPQTLNYPLSVSQFSCLFAYCWGSVLTGKCKWSGEKHGCIQLGQPSVGSPSLVHVHSPGGVE